MELVSRDVLNSNETEAPIVSVTDLVNELSRLISAYLESKPFLGLSAISGRCQVSESTLRRIHKKQIKTLPTPATVVAILTFFAGEGSIPALIKKYPGVIASYLEENFPHTAEIDCQYSEELNQELRDSTKYLVFKLSSHSCGCTENQVRDLLGQVGVSSLQELVRRNLIKKEGERYISAIERYSLDPDMFKDKFQFMSQFLKIARESGPNRFQNAYSNYSSSLTPEAYQKVVKVQKQALKKIRDIMLSESSQGDIHMFALSAIDTIDF